MRISEYENTKFKGQYAEFDFCELISKVIVTPETPSLAFLQEYDIESDIHVRKN